MTVKFEEVRRKVLDTGIKMFQSHLVVGTWGNISSRVPGEKYIAITPSGVDYEIIKPEDIVIMDMDGNTVDGQKKPSIEYPLHLAVYNNRQDINAVIHTHSTYCTAMAMARKPIPAAAEDLVQIVGGNVRVSEYYLPGTYELAGAVVKAMEGRNAVLLANHGALGAGKDLKETLKIVSVVEKTAQATIFAQILGGVVELAQENVDSMRDFYLHKYGRN